MKTANSELRLHGWAMGLILLAASLFVASTVTAVINFILLAIPILAMAALIALLVMGIPMVAAGIQAGREARKSTIPAIPRLLGVSGSWKHPHRWTRAYHPHYLGFQSLDHKVAIHPDSSRPYRSRGLEDTLEGLSSWTGSGREARLF